MRKEQPIPRHKAKEQNEIKGGTFMKILGRVCRIADADLKNAGGVALFKQVHGMIKLREGKTN